MELKTLKDLVETELTKINDGYEIIDRIKQEAIKWIKAGKEGIIFCFLCNKWDKDYLMHLDNGHKILRITEDCEDVLKYFFNITEEDLK